MYTSWDGEDVKGLGFVEVSMSKVKNIEREIQDLKPEELSAFRKWFAEFDAEVWDRQIEDDARSGKLDNLADAAIKSFMSGNRSEL